MVVQQARVMMLQQTGTCDGEGLHGCYVWAVELRKLLEEADIGAAGASPELGGRAWDAATAGTKLKFTI